MGKLTSTKSNLIKSKSMLELSKKGYKPQDRKRNILVKEMMERTEEIKKIRKEIENKFEDIYRAMIYLNMTMGENAVEEIALSVPKNENIKILSKSMMGVEIPYVKFDEKEIQPYYGFYRTNPALDIVVKKSKEVQRLLYRLTEYENAILRIAEEIKKTTKRANALDKIKIPKFEETTKGIEESLEEKERQEFFRLKSVKKKL